MSNICSNELRVSGLSDKTLLEVLDWFAINIGDKPDVMGDEKDNNEISALFDSNWTFPDELMDDLYNSITDKENLHMVCLSVEWGCFYCAFHTCDKNGWRLET